MTWGKVYVGLKGRPGIRALLRAAIGRPQCLTRQPLVAVWRLAGVGRRLSVSHVGDRRRPGARLTAIYTRCSRDSCDSKPSSHRLARA